MATTITPGSTAHLTINGRPACDMFHTIADMAELRLALRKAKLGPYLFCSYLKLDHVEKVAVVPGECPEAFRDTTQ